MITINIDIKNLDRLRANVSKAPTLAFKYLGKAVDASIAEVEKEAVDRNFQFKTPRALRSGDLEKSWKFGRYIHPSKLYAKIGPTVHYAPYVYYGTGRGLKANRYMDRIASASEAKVNKHFEKAIDLFLKDIAT